MVLKQRSECSAMEGCRDQWEPLLIPLWLVSLLQGPTQVYLCQFGGILKARNQDSNEEPSLESPGQWSGRLIKIKFMEGPESLG